MKFYTAMHKHARLDRTTPLQSVLSLVLSTMTVECDRFTCLLNVQHVLLHLEYLLFLSAQKKTQLHVYIYISLITPPIYTMPSFGGYLQKDVMSLTTHR